MNLDHVSVAAVQEYGFLPLLAAGVFDKKKKKKPAPPPPKPKPAPASAPVAAAPGPASGAVAALGGVLVLAVLGGVVWMFLRRGGKPGPRRKKKA